MDDLTKRVTTLSPAKRALLERRLASRNGGGPRLAARTGDGPARASFAQERLWFLHQIEPQSAAYNVPRAIRILGNLDLNVLHQRLNEIVARHDPLRTHFALVDGSLRQIVAENVSIELPVVELEEHESARRAAELIKHETALPFDLSTGPVLRAQLLRFHTTEHLLLVTMHHIVSDAWSAGIFFQELTTLYKTFSEQWESPLAPLKLQYADYAEWQRDRLQGEVLAEQLRYWQSKLNDAPAILDLPTDRPRPSQTNRGASCTTSISESLTEQLRELSSSGGATLFMTLLAAFSVLLHRYSGEDDIVIGTPIAGRNRAEVEGLIGFFINTLPLRIDIAGNPSFNALLARVKQTALEGYEHQDLPFEKLVEELRPERSNRMPFFQVMFQYQHAPRDVASLNGVTFLTEAVESHTSKFDLSLGAYERDGVLKFQLEYSTDLFDRETIETMLSRFTILLQSIVSDPDISVGQLSIMTDAERGQLLVDWNDTFEDFGEFESLQQKFERQAAQSPDAPAIIYEDQQLTFAELNERANKLAHYLKKAGVEEETGVAVFLERSPDMIVALLGVLKAGGAYVPLDVSYPNERIDYVLQDSRARVVLTHEKWRSALPANDLLLVSLDDDWDQIDRESAANLAATAHPETAAYVIYTSGSTGKPKGVVGLHGATVNRLEWMYRRYPFAADEVCCQKTSLSFVDSIWEIFGPLLTGVPLVILPEEVAKDVDHFIDALDKNRVTRLVLVPSLLRAMLATGDGIGRRISQLKSWTSSGEALPLPLAESFKHHFPDAILLNLYGSSEVAADVTYYEVEQSALPDIPLGRPIPNTQLYILDSNREPVPVGVTGEIYVGGANLARGYLDRPELTAEKFVPHPFANTPGQRLYRTGDLGRFLGTGDVEYRGRTDHQVKIRGSRIELGEIQSALDTHPEIRASIVLVHEDASGEKRLTAYVLSRGKRLSNRDVRAYLGKKLPEFMVPASIVVLEDFPRTASGKIDRLSLPKPVDVREDQVAPRNLTEEIVAEVFTDILAVDEISVNDDFFALGGHSLLIPRVINRLNELFAVDLPMRALFDNSRISELADTIASLRSVDTAAQTPIVPVSRNGELPLTFAQESLWAIEQFAPATGAYNISRVLRLKGNLNIDVLQRSINTIVSRHEILRTVFRSNNGKPFALIDRACKIDLAIKINSEAEMRPQVTDEARRPFDLAKGLLMRATLFRLAEDDHILMVTMHHIISDGWSMNIFLDELVSHYHDLLTDNELEVTALPIQYADFAEYQRKSLQSDKLKTSLAYWQQQLAGVPAIAELPINRPRPAIRTFQGNRYAFEIPGDLTAALKQLARDERVTLFMTLLAAFHTLLWSYSNHDNVVTGSPSAGRRPGTENLIGYFVNTLALKTNFSGDPTFRQIMRRVAETTLEALAHEHVPFVKVVEALQTERTLSHNPVFQVWFVLQAGPGLGERRDFPGLVTEPYAIDSEVTRHDLQLTMWENSGVLKAAFTYSTDIFDLETVSAMAEEFLTVLSRIVEEADIRSSDLRRLFEQSRDMKQQQLARQKLQSARRRPSTDTRSV
ncbi:MAG TPA: amino acid adenylation domain-containing protein [Pyrinomonadaceae bacterium]|nr:amino acid adenylation domain-containing protein [Pyrinomonadaceae bacterium]